MEDVTPGTASIDAAVGRILSHGRNSPRVGGSSLRALSTNTQECACPAGDRHVCLYEGRRCAGWLLSSSPTARHDGPDLGAVNLSDVEHPVEEEGSSAVGDRITGRHGCVT